MSKICQITGKRQMSGNNVAHSNKRTKRKFLPNMMKKKFYLEEEKRYITLHISAQGLRIIDKNGISKALKKAQEKGYVKL